MASTEDQKKILIQIKDAERTYHGCLTRRMQIYEELKELDTQEAELREYLAKKKEELRASQSPSRRGRGMVRTVSMTFNSEPLSVSPQSSVTNLTSPTSVEPTRVEPTPPSSSPPQTMTITRSASGNTTSLTRKNSGNEKNLTQSTGALPRQTAPKYLTSIEIIDKFGKTDNVWETLYPGQYSGPISLIPLLKIKNASVTNLFGKPKGSIFSEPLGRLFGPITQEPVHSSLLDPSEDCYKNVVCAKSVSTYPSTIAKERRDGDPICDRYLVEIFPHCVAVAMADGCNWGNRPRSAGMRAAEGFVNYLKQINIKNMKDMGRHLLKGISFAHNNIIQGLDDVWDAGTTTLLGGALVEVEYKGAKKKETNNNNKVGVSNGDIPNWAFACVSVGDCKAFYWNHKTRRVSDITEGNRNNLTDASDPGGRIGPYLEGGTPDLRNIDLYFTMCDEGDFIIILSDGVHDNLDPQFLGKSPQYFDIPADSWKEAEKLFLDETEEAKCNFRNKLIEDLINITEHNVKEMTPTDLCRAITQYCTEVTENGRKFLQSHPTKRIPDDTTLYPGKMDHTSVVVLKVGKLT